MFEKLTLENDWVKLEPFDESHLESLAEVAQDEELWQYMPVSLQTPEHFKQFLQHAGLVHSRGEGVYFVIRDKRSGKIAGATGFWNADLQNRRAEIGFTWVVREFQRTPVNTSCKLLLMTYGFETMDLNRVEFKTDSLNTKSRTALTRIGAQEEGTLRCHVVQPDGRLRHSVYFSVIKEEWPQVKSTLETKLQPKEPEGN